MSFRCTNAFTYLERVVSGGALVDDDDPILTTHAAHFTKVNEPPAPTGETASTMTPRAKRGPGRPKKTAAVVESGDVPDA